MKCNIDYEELVSIHAPVWVRRQIMMSSSSADMFQSTHPFGCDYPDSGQNKAAHSFNPRTRLGATLDFSHNKYPLLRFNPRTRLGATGGGGEYVTTQEFQSTHPFGCDFTPILRGLFFLRFNPRTRLGATIQVVPLPANGSSFNPRTRLGATSIRNVVGLVDRVSIHAPVWVRLNPLTMTVTFRVVSIHAPVWVRLYRSDRTISLAPFQSTHPFGCDY